MFQEKPTQCWNMIVQTASFQMTLETKQEHPFMHTCMHFLHHSHRSTLLSVTLFALYWSLVPPSVPLSSHRRFLSSSGNLFTSYRALVPPWVPLIIGGTSSHRIIESIFRFYFLIHGRLLLLSSWFAPNPILFQRARAQLMGTSWHSCHWMLGFTLGSKNRSPKLH